MFQEVSTHLPELQEAFPQLCHAQVSSPHLPHSQVTSPHLPHPHVTSPQLCHGQVSSPHLPRSQVTSPHLHYSHVTSPKLPHPHVASPHLHYSHVTSPQLCHAQVSSPQLPHSQVTSPHLHYSLVTSPQLPHPHVTSPQLPHPHVTSPQLPHSHVTSPQLPHPHVTSPQLPHPHVTSPHLHYPHVTSPQLPHPHVTSPQLPHPHVTSPQLPHPQLISLHLTSPHFTNPADNSYQYASQSYDLSQCQGAMPYHQYPHVASPDFVVTSPNLVAQGQVAPHPPPQNAFPSQSHNSGLDDSNWNRSEVSPELSGFSNSYSYCYQVQTTAHLDFSLQNELSGGMTHQKGVETDITHRLPCNTHTLMDGSLYSKVDACSPAQDTWEPLEPTLSKMQHSPPCSVSGGAPMGRWNSMEFSSSSAEDFSNTQLFPDSYHDNPASQSFHSPINPDPHYPQTPTTSSPGPQIHLRKERLGVPTQTSTHVSTTKTFRSCLQESDSYLVNSDPSHHQPHETSSSLVAIKAEPNQDQLCFPTQGRGQDASSAAQSLGLSSRLNWKGERGARGRKVGGEGNGQPGWAWIKRSPRENSTEAPGYRLQCTVCKRDFRSLPALNGHMRSHSGVRAAACLKKRDDSVSMVMPVSVPVQARGASKMCRAGQRTCSHLAPPSGGTGLFRSLLHLEDEPEATSSRSHYTPPPMLCPHRGGPGLYCSITGRQQSEASRPAATPAGSRRPRINVGLDFQAQIPSLRNQRYMSCDSHNALLLWTPWDKLEGPANQERVEAFLTMSQSSVMPSGGVSPEYALHVLSESRGDFLLTLEKLLSTPKASIDHTGWSATERRQLVKSLQQHHKDFSSIQRDIQTKSLSQCVEFYYLWKKKMSLTVKIPVGLTITLPNTGQRSRSNQSINECVMKSRTGQELHTTG